MFIGLANAAVTITGLANAAVTLMEHEPAVTVAELTRAANPISVLAHAAVASRTQLAAVLNAASSRKPRCQV